MSTNPESKLAVSPKYIGYWNCQQELAGPHIALNLVDIMTLLNYF